MPGHVRPLPSRSAPPMAPGGAPWFGSEDAPALRDFFAVYEAHVDVHAIFREAAAVEPALAGALAAMTPDWSPEVVAEKRVILRRAFEAGEWAAYESDLRREGAIYATHGVRHWQAITRAVVRATTPRLVAAHEGDPPRLAAALAVMHQFLDHVRATVGDGYLQRREAMVREVEARAQRLVDSSMVGVWVIDAAGATSFMNDRIARILGVEAARAIGAVATSFLDGAGTSELSLRVAGARPAGAGAFEERLRRADGATVWALVETSALFDGAGQREGTLAMVTDVTERHVAEALRAANVELEHFSSAAAHDLRAPLRAIEGFARAIAEDFGATLDPTAADWLGRIQANAGRMDRLIDALLALARATRAPLDPREVDLSTLAREVVAELRAAEPGRAVEAEIEGGLVARIDPALARTLLANLLGNAWKFTARVAQARVEIARDGAAVRVRDNGAGFEMSRAGRLFEPFERLHRAGEFPGTGLGLATSQRIVARHGGRMWATSRPGEGATFWFEVPRGG